MVAFGPDSPIAATGLAAARKAATIVARHFGNLAAAGIHEKISGHFTEGLVSEADVQAEAAIIETIKANFPDHAILAEESHTTVSGDDENLWVIDPLDGTNNFVFGIEHFAISIAFYHQNVAAYGIVIDVTRGVEYQAYRGGGAWQDDRRVHVSDHQRLDQTMIGVGFYYDRGEKMKATLAAIELLFRSNIHGIRRFGTAALDLIHVGLGRFGGFFEYTLSPWDFAAGRLFVEEAGGRVTTCDGSDLPLERSSVLASNGMLHETLLNIVSTGRHERLISSTPHSSADISGHGQAETDHPVKTEEEIKEASDVHEDG